MSDFLLSYARPAQPGQRGVRVKARADIIREIEALLAEKG